MEGSRGQELHSSGEGWTEVRAASGDRRSGAAEIGRRAAEALAALPPGDLQDAVAALVRGHPPMAPLWRLGTEVLSAGDHRDAARRFALALAAERDAVAAAAAPLLGGTVVVHSYSSTLVAAVALASARALCARSEPGGEGEVTARRLAEMGVEALVLDDEQAAAEAARTDAVVVGADAVGPGGVVNKVGTNRLAEVARRAGRAAIVVAGSSKLIAVDVPAPHPFERVPPASFTAIVLEDGPVHPEEAARRALSFTLHPALERLLVELR